VTTSSLFLVAVDVSTEIGLVQQKSGITLCSLVSLSFVEASLHPTLHTPTVLAKLDSFPDVSI